MQLLPVDILSSAYKKLDLFYLRYRPLARIFPGRARCLHHNFAQVIPARFLGAIKDTGPVYADHQGACGRHAEHGRPGHSSDESKPSACNGRGKAISRSICMPAFRPSPACADGGILHGRLVQTKIGWGLCVRRASWSGQVVPLNPPEKWLIFPGRTPIRPPTLERHLIGGWFRPKAADRPENVDVLIKVMIAVPHDLSPGIFQGTDHFLFNK